MIMSYPSLAQMRPGQAAFVRQLHLTGAIHQRLVDLGLVEGTHIACVHRSPSGDPSAYLFRGAVIALRQCDTRQIEVSEWG